MSLLTELNRKYGSFGTYYLVNTNQDVIVFGSLDNDDMVIKSNLPIVRKKISMFSKNSVMKISEKDLLDLYKKFILQIKSTPVGIFNFDKSYISPLFDTVNYIKATHIRFFKDDNKIKIRLFDYRNFVNDVTPLVDENFGISEVVLKEVDSFSEFSFSLKTTTFLKLPINNYEIEVLENGIIGFISQDDDTEYYFRDQEITEPIVSFVNEKHNLQTSFWFLPKIDTTWVNTNQLID